MATILKAGNVATGAQITSDATGILEIRTGSGAGTTAMTIGTDQAVAIGGNNISAANSFGFRNRIINGAMVIDQRNNGASVAITTSDNYTLDRWQGTASANSRYTIQQNAASVTPPAGFINYLGATSVSSGAPGSTDAYLISQFVEGLNVADLGWGTANAQTVTLSFWVRSSLTGAFGGTVTNSAANRSYPFSYTISSANTWEQKTITIAGDTSGTWLTTNGIGLRLRFSMGMGSSYLGTAGAWAGSFVGAPTGSTNVIATNGATWYVTGVQLEAGSVATPFERRDYGRELMMCQRYYYRNFPAATARYLVTTAWANQTTTAYGIFQFPVTMRTSPSALEQTGTAGDYAVFLANTATTCSAVPTFNSATETNSLITFTVSSGLTVGQAGTARTTGTAGYLAWSAEL
jgi:hypothetical protein